MSEVSLYVHIPFCQKRCSYCDFNTYSHLEQYISPYMKALRREISEIAQKAEEQLAVRSIYFGGGTPSYVPVKEIEKIIFSLRMYYDWKGDIEISMEANPGTLSKPALEEYVSMGIRRISLGVQSGKEDELRLLERIHMNREVEQSVRWAREAGIGQLNLDLIYGIPGQTLKSWEESLDFVLSFEPEHLSLYSLTVEKGTKLEKWVQEGKVNIPDGDFAADCYELASELLSARGYVHYEISNWARRNEEGEIMSCKHNEQYWKNLPYFGFGAGAHSFVNNLRIANVYHPLEYIQRMINTKKEPYPFSSAVGDFVVVDVQTEMDDTMMLGLRLLEEGVGVDDFFRRFRISLEDVYQSRIQKLIDFGLVEWFFSTQKRLRLTKRGQLLGNQVFIEFV